MNKGTLRTKGSTYLIIFCLIVLLCSSGIIVLFSFLDEPLVLKIFVFVISGIFIALSFFILLVQLFDYVYVKNDCLVHQKIFFKQKINGKTKINVHEITKVIYNKDAYEIYVGSKKFCSLDPKDAGSKLILLYLEQHKVSVKAV